MERYEVYSKGYQDFKSPTRLEGMESYGVLVVIVCVHRSPTRLEGMET